MACTSLIWAHWGRASSPGAQAGLVGALPTAPPRPPFSGLPVGRMWRGHWPRDRPPSVPLCRWVELGTVYLMEREDSSLLRAQEMISMQMRCKLLNEFAIRSLSLPGPGNAFGFYEWAGAGRGEAARRSAPTAPSLRARDMPRRTLLPPGPPQLGRSPAGQLLRTAREAVGQSPRHAACRRRVGAEDTPPWGPVRALSSGAPFPVMGMAPCCRNSEASLWAGSALPPNLLG